MKPIESTFMKHLKLLIVMVAGGLLVCGAGGLQAQIVPLRVSLKLTVQVQDLNGVQVGTSAVNKYTIKKVKVTNKDILNLLAAANQEDYTDGELAVDDSNGDFVVIDDAGNVLDDATDDGYFSNFYDTETDSVASGKSNADTQDLTFRDVFFNSVTFDDSNGTNFSLNGAEQFNTARKGSSGKFKLSFGLSGSGAGEVGGSFGIVTGVLTGKGGGIDL